MRERKHLGYESSPIGVKLPLAYVEGELGGRESIFVELYELDCLNVGRL